MLSWNRSKTSLVNVYSIHQISNPATLTVIILFAFHCFKTVKTVKLTIRILFFPDQIDLIANDLMYWPSSESLYSTSGCKRVGQKVDLLLGDLDDEEDWTKKSTEIRKSVSYVLVYLTFWSWSTLCLYSGHFLKFWTVLMFKKVMKHYFYDPKWFMWK